MGEFRRKTAKQSGLVCKGLELEEIARRRLGCGDGTEYGGLRKRCGGAPFIEATLNFGLPCGPCGAKQTFAWRDEFNGRAVGGFIAEAREKMQLFAGARGGDVEEAAGFVELALVTLAIDPLFCYAATGAFLCKRRDEEFRDIIAGFGIS